MSLKKLMLCFLNNKIINLINYHMKEPKKLKLILSKIIKLIDKKIILFKIIKRKNKLKLKIK